MVVKICLGRNVSIEVASRMKKMREYIFSSLIKILNDVDV